MAKVKFTLVGKIQITAQQVLFFGNQGTFPAALTSGGSTTTTLTQANFTDFDFNIHTDGELSAAWETNSQAVTIEANGSTFVIPGPDSSEANPKDSTHSYTWRVPGYSYQALVTALIADSSPTIEFSDEDIVPAELAATATAGTPSAVATLAAIDAPEELAATATAGTPSAVATLAAIDAPEELAATATAGTPSAVATLAAIDAPEELAATATAGTPSAVATLASAGPRLTLSPVFPLHARDGQGFEFIYALHSAEIAANQLPLNEWTFEQVGNGIDRNGVTWTDDAGSVTMAQPLLSISVRKVLAGVNVGDAVPAQWSAPGVVGRYAIDGADGEDAHGFEYIFTSAADESLPLASRPDNAWGFDVGGTAGAHTWTDGAPSLTSALPVLFRSQRAIIGSPSTGDAVADDWTVPVVVGRYAVDGVAGLAGASIHYGAGVPAASLGNDGDIYVRANGLLYTKSGGAWTATGDDLTGPPNARTYAAGVVQAGSTPAVPANAINGSVIIANDGRFWELVGGSWSYRGDLTGPVGPGGGAIRTGSTAPADSLGNDGDLYIRDTGEIYTKSGGTWTDTGIDLISDMAAAAGARIYALGDVAVGSTPAVPSMAIDGSIGVANDGRFWELVNGAWVYRDDLTGPQGEGGANAAGHVLSRTFESTSVAGNVAPGEFQLAESSGQVTLLRIGYGSDLPYLAAVPAGTVMWLENDSGDTEQYALSAGEFISTNTDVLSFQATQLSGRKDLTAGTSYTLRFTYGLGDPGEDAFGRAFNRTNIALGASIGANGFRVNVALGVETGFSISEGDSSNEDYFDSIGPGSAVWFQGENYRWRAEILAAGSRSIGTPIWHFNSIRTLGVREDATVGNPYRVVFTQAGGGGSTPGNTVPGVPRNLSASASSLTQIDLSWDAPQDNGGAAITGYRIDVSSTSASTGFTTLVNSQTGTTYSHTGLSAGDQRWYRVYAINSVGTSTSYASGTATTAAESAPSAPRSVSLTGVAGGGVTASWAAPSSWGTGTTGSRKFERRFQRTDNNSGATSWVEVDDSVTSYSATNAAGRLLFPPGATFRIDVRALTDDGTGSSSSDTATIPAAATAPGRPTGVSLGSTQDGMTVVGQWDAPSDWGSGSTSSRKYEYRIDSGSWVEVDDSVETTGLIDGFTPGQEVTFDVRSKTDAGTSTFVSRTRTTNDHSNLAPVTYSYTWNDTSSTEDEQLSDGDFTLRSSFGSSRMYFVPYSATRRADILARTNLVIAGGTASISRTVTDAFRRIDSEVTGDFLVVDLNADVEKNDFTQGASYSFTFDD